MKSAVAAHRQANKGEIAEELQVGVKELDAHITLANKRIDKGLKQLAKASSAERKLTYREPPYYPRPAAEALGQSAMLTARPLCRAGVQRRALAISGRSSRGNSPPRASRQQDPGYRILKPIRILGGGPAGSSAALAALKYGSSVEVIERSRFPRHKVCGDFSRRALSRSWPS